MLVDGTISLGCAVEQVA